MKNGIYLEEEAANFLRLEEEKRNYSSADDVIIIVFLLLFPDERGIHLLQLETVPLKKVFSGVQFAPDSAQNLIITFIIIKKKTWPPPPLKIQIPFQTMEEKVMILYK